MRCPIVAELPPPPPGKTGWPWTVATPPLPPARPDGSPWPRISIVTPSYHQGQFIEETIRSILLQGYPDLEYLIIDGGSTDQSVDIIRKYQPWLAYWVSERDRGQAHAINKGLAKSTGEIFQFINSDDVVVRDALRAIASAFAGDAVGAAVLSGFNVPDGRIIQSNNLSVASLLEGAVIMQPGVWLRRENVEAVGISEQLHYNFAWDLIIRYLERFPSVAYIPEVVVNFRVHDASKSVRDRGFFAGEELLIRARLSRSLADPTHRAICRKALRRRIWERHLTMWRTYPPEARRGMAKRMVLLAFRNPRRRISRFWFGALRRTLLAHR